MQKVHKQEQNKRAFDPTVVRLKKNDSYLFLLPDKMFKAGKLAEIVEDLDQLEKEEDPLYHEEWVRQNVFYPRIVEGGSEEDQPEPTLDKEPPDYIRIDFSDNGATPYDLRTNSYSDESKYVITCPSDFLTESSSPLSDVNLKDSVIMELNLKGDRLGTKEDHLRIYDRESYFRYRHEEWCRTGPNPVPREFPVIGGIVSWFLDRTPNLSGQYEGDRFRFVVFDAHHSAFREQYELDEYNVPPSDLFFQVKENGRLPQQKADIEIWWDPSGGDESGFDPSIKLYDEKNCAETSVILPKQGYFLVKSYTQAGKIETWLGRSSSERFQQSRGWERKVGDGWYGFFPEDQENEEGFRLYVPAKTMD